MPLDAIVHAAVWRELPRDEHAGARDAMRAITRLDHVIRSAHVSTLAGSAYDRSYRLRFGRYRILFIVFPDEGTIAFTTAFLKRRDVDYGPAIARHDARVRSHE